jgi:amino acid adenylation domain-containing protein
MFDRNALPATFLAAADRAPDRTALRAAGSSWTYGEVRTAALDLVAVLREHGIRTGDRVGLLSARAAGGPIAMLGIMLAGATYVPIDPLWPAARRADIARRAQLALALTADADVEPPPECPALRLTTQGLRRTGDTVAGELHLDGSLPAYVVFTSGSTGGPKAVLVRSSAAANLVTGTAARLDLGEDAVFVSLSAFTFDASVFEIFGSLSVGAELVVAAPEDLEPRRLARLLDIDRPVFTQTTPTVAEHLLAAGFVPPTNLTLLLCGEPLRDSLVRRFATISQLWNLYGPTEATVYATAHACLPIEPAGAGPGADLPIGEPVAGARLEIRPDPDGDPDTGELIIGGPGVALGYLGDPELTARHFIDGGTRYATGDVVRRRPDGALVFVGRRDRQVKIRGHRVELDEIEAVIVGLVGHGRVAVLALDDDHIGRYAAAFVEPGGAVSVDDLPDRMAALVPRHLVPARFHEVAELPMKPNGKLDRGALTAGAGAGAGAGPDAGQVRSWLVERWQEILGREVETTSNFYALGGHSLLAMRVAIAIEDIYGVEMEVTTVLRTPVLHELADEVVARLRVAV